uniref:Uncharacterized protein n=1 Tax=Pararge aegeria TaxID=116150 RepID=S4PED8_9NEOP
MTFFYFETKNTITFQITLKPSHQNVCEIPGSDESHKCHPFHNVFCGTGRQDVLTCQFISGFVYRCSTPSK